MTELVVVSRPRMRYLRWIGGGVYKTYLTQINTPQVDLVKPDYGGFTETAIPMYSGSLTRVAQQIIAPSSGLLSNLALVRVVARLQRVGSPTGTLNVRLYSDSNDTPGSLLATIGSIDVSTISTTATNYTFDAATPYTVTQGAKYWISVEYGGGNSSNYVAAFKDAGTDRDTSVLGASFLHGGIGWTSEIYDRAMAAGFQANYSYGPFDFIYSGFAEKRLRITESSAGISITARTLNTQSFSSAINETTIIPQADSYSLIYTVRGAPSSYLSSGTFSLTIQRYLYYGATSITLNQLGYSEGYIWKITFPTGTNQLQVDDNPDTIFSGTNTTMSFADAPIPFRKLEWILGSGEVEILVVE
jgi:hypothetical protein